MSAAPGGRASCARRATLANRASLTDFLTARRQAHYTISVFRSLLTDRDNCVIVNNSDSPATDKLSTGKRPTHTRGRGTAANESGRYESLQHDDFDDGWYESNDTGKPKTSLQADSSRSVLVYNQSPDLSFDRSVNPYRGCEHGCIYCYARPSHAYLGLSPGLDFETQLFYKENAATQLEQALHKPGYRAKTIALGVNTDAYQPADRKLAITRSILEVLQDFRHPVSIITKSSLIERDLDILAEMATDNLVSVHISITTLQAELARKLEPRAAAPHRRLETIRRLHDAGVPVSLLMAPVIPALTDHEMEAILNASVDAGVQSASWILLRLPLEVSDLFQQWLEDHYPLKAKHVVEQIRRARGGKLNDSEFGSRMTGIGDYASVLSQRFKLTCKKLGIGSRREQLNCELFTVPTQAGDQFDLF